MTTIIFNALIASSLVQAPQQHSIVEYVFVKDTERLVAIDRGDVFLSGRLDADGEFHQTKRIEANNGVIQSFGPSYRLLNGGSNTPRTVYEFRSGILIPGTIKSQGNFIPEVGGKIIKFEDYKYSPTGIQIWNLPGHFE